MSTSGGGGGGDNPDGERREGGGEGGHGKDDSENERTRWKDSPMPFVFGDILKKKWGRVVYARESGDSVLIYTSNFDDGEKKYDCKKLTVVKLPKKSTASKKVFKLPISLGEDGTKAEILRQREDKSMPVNLANCRIPREGLSSENGKVQVCYMNAIVQVLYACDLFRREVLGLTTDEIEKACRDATDQKTRNKIRVLRELRDLFARQKFSERVKVETTPLAYALANAGAGNMGEQMDVDIFMKKLIYEGDMFSGKLVGEGVIVTAFKALGKIDKDGKTPVEQCFGFTRTTSGVGAKPLFCSKIDLRFSSASALREDEAEKMAPTASSATEEDKMRVEAMGLPRDIAFRSAMLTKRSMYHELDALNRKEGGGAASLSFITTPRVLLMCLPWNERRTPTELRIETDLFLDKYVQSEEGGGASKMSSDEIGDKSTPTPPVEEEKEDDDDEEEEEEEESDSDDDDDDDDSLRWALAMSKGQKPKDEEVRMSELKETLETLERRIESLRDNPTFRHLMKHRGNAAVAGGGSSVIGNKDDDADDIMSALRDFDAQVAQCREGALKRLQMLVAQHAHTRQEIYALNKRTSKHHYELASVIVRQGDSSDLGHFYAYVRRDGGSWFKCDDRLQTTQKVELETVRADASYTNKERARAAICLYRRVDAAETCAEETCDETTKRRVEWEDAVVRHVKAFAPSSTPQLQKKKVPAAENVKTFRALHKRCANCHIRAQISTPCECKPCAEHYLLPFSKLLKCAVVYNSVFKAVEGNYDRMLLKGTMCPRCKSTFTSEISHEAVYYPQLENSGHYLYTEEGREIGDRSKLESFRDGLRLGIDLSLVQLGTLQKLTRKEFDGFDKEVAFRALEQANWDVEEARGIYENEYKILRVMNTVSLLQMRLDERCGEKVPRIHMTRASIAKDLADAGGDVSKCIDRFETRLCNENKKRLQKGMMINFLHSAGMYFKKSKSTMDIALELRKLDQVAVTGHLERANGDAKLALERIGRTIFEGRGEDSASKLWDLMLLELLELLDVVCSGGSPSEADGASGASA
eukprot:g2183.t1